MRLLVVSDYSNHGVSYKAGDVVPVPEWTAQWLMADSPGSFKVIPDDAPPEVAKAPEAPTVDKMQRRRLVK